MLNFTVDWDTSLILMNVDVPQNTELRIRFHEHLFEQLEQQRPEGYCYGDTLIMVMNEVQEQQVTWEYTELEVIATMPLEAGTKTIEIVSTVPIEETQVNNSLLDLNRTQTPQCSKNNRNAVL